MDDPWLQLLDELHRHWPVSRWRDLGVVIGCSGGADSVALVSALAALRNAPGSTLADPPRGFLVVAHFNHRLRGKASEQDEESTRRLAEQLGLRWHRGAAESPRADEASMRDDRIRFLVQTAHATGARYVALGHSADDNVETMLHHLFRGTGPAGLAGISSPRSLAQDLVLVRPLLHIRRALIRSALASQSIPWREDASNDNLAYQRNWIRHELLPLIESRYPNAVEAIGRAMDGQRQWRKIIDPLAEAWLDEHQVQTCPVMLQRDQASDPAIVVAALQKLWNRCGWPRGDMTQRHWTQLARTLSHHQTTRYALPAGIDVQAQENLVTLRGPAN